MDLTWMQENEDGEIPKISPDLPLRAGEYRVVVTSWLGDTVYSDRFPGARSNADEMFGVMDNIPYWVDEHFHLKSLPANPELDKATNLTDKFLILLRQNPKPEYGKNAYAFPFEGKRLLFRMTSSADTQLAELRQKLIQSFVIKKIKNGGPGEPTIFEILGESNT